MNDGRRQGRRAAALYLGFKDAGAFLAPGRPGLERSAAVIAVNTSNEPEPGRPIAPREAWHFVTAGAAPPLTVPSPPWLAGVVRHSLLDGC